MCDLVREVQLVCPTCGCTEFAMPEKAEGAEWNGDEVISCANCGRSMTRDELIEENSVAAENAVLDMEQEILNAALVELGGSCGTWTIG